MAVALKPSQLQAFIDSYDAYYSFLSTMTKGVLPVYTVEHVIHS